jgi:hypothetical protein
MRAAVMVVLSMFLFTAPARAAGTVRWTGPAPTVTDATLLEKLKSADEAYAERDKAGRMDEALTLLRTASAAQPGQYDIEWRLARACFWAAESTAEKAKKKALAREGMNAGDRAVTARADGAAGLYFLALCIGEYSHSVGVLTALTEGVEGRFRDPLLKASEKEFGIDNGGVWNALGRYKFELPWPKRDYDQSVAWLRKSLEANPRNLRGRVYLAESLAARDSKGDVDEAKRLVFEVISAVPGQYDLPEELRAQQFAKQLVARLGWKP